MKNFKTILLTLLFSIGFIFPSCKKEKIGIRDSCDGVDFDSYRYFDIKGLEAFVFKKDINSFEIVSSLDTISFSENTGIYMQYLAEYHAATSLSLSLINSTMACSFIGGFDGSKTEKLTHLSIITLNDFDEEHLANSPINDLLEVQLRTFNEDKLPLLEYLANQTENIKHQTLLLNLNKAPELNSEFKFKIEVLLSTGESYEVESNPVYFRE